MVCQTESNRSQLGQQRRGASNLLHHATGGLLTFLSEGRGSTRDHDGRRLPGHHTLRNHPARGRAHDGVRARARDVATDPRLRLRRHVNEGRMRTYGKHC